MPFGGGGISINSGTSFFNAGNDVKITKMLSRSFDFMATEAATLQSVTRSFLWHSIMLFIGAAGLYCVAPSIYTGLSGTVLIGLHLLSGFCVGLISRPVRQGISKRLFGLMLVDIALLVMYTISLNVFHQFHVVVSAFAFILLLLAPLLVACCSWALGGEFANIRAGLKGKHVADGSALHGYPELALYSPVVLLIALLVGLQFLLVPLMDSIGSFLSVNAEMGVAALLVEPLAFGNAAVILDTDCLFSRNINIGAVLLSFGGHQEIVLLLVTVLGSILARAITRFFPDLTSAFSAAAKLGGKHSAVADIPTASGFSQRESAVFSMRIEGKTYEEIASALDISPSTARTYLSRALTKTGYKSISEATAGLLLSKDAWHLDATKGHDHRSESLGSSSFNQNCRIVFVCFLFMYASGMGIEEILVCFGFEHDAIILSIAIVLVALCCRAAIRWMSEMHLCLSPELTLSSVSVGAGAAFWVHDVVSRLYIFFESVGSGEAVGGLMPALRVTAFLVVLILMANSLLFLRSKDTVRVGDRRDTVREAFLRLGFTPLYADIMTCVFDGNRTTEICAHLNVARGTVKEAKSKSYALIGVHSERELRDRVFSLMADVIENSR